MSDRALRSLSLGAAYLGNGRCRFRVWAPRARRVELHIVSPSERLEPLRSDPCGYHQAELEGIEPGARYFFRLDGGPDRPDPASRSQPEGVHQASQVVDPAAHAWGDADWRGLALEHYILYELHVGTFSPAGTFDAAIPYLDRLRELGVTAIELMPVAQFPGDRNWGYDGVAPFAVQHGYGGPGGLKRLVDACHARGLAAVLDVVYNHLGPEGNYLAEFGPYFSDRFRTPWGPALNFDGPESDDVRAFFIENALTWLTEYHFDALRLDAIHGIRDFSAQPFLAELADAVHARTAELGRPLYLIAESNLNAARVVEPRARGGLNLDAQWNDDLHYALHALLTGERSGTYADFGALEQLGAALRYGFVFTGQYSRYRRRRHGTPARELPAQRFVVFGQNHDQVGNRIQGERLSALVGADALRLAAGVVLLAPYVPLLFMGEEYGETAPFLYFVSHSDPELIEAVRQGRRRELAAFGWSGAPPDPQDPATFERCKLQHLDREPGPHRQLRDLYRELIRLRKLHPALAQLSKDHLEIEARREQNILLLRRWCGADQIWAAFHFGAAAIEAKLPVPAGAWRLLIDSAAQRWGGTGGDLPQRLESDHSVSLRLRPYAFALYGSDDAERT
ncbi:MAG TPA: malto-oligosyltrehalose trehalohydrolase [Acidobacteriota bacterium]